jgi:uncharacterized repeat protein (TIGR01451 family)
MDFCGFSIFGNRSLKRATETNQGFVRLALAMLLLITCGAPLWAQSPGYTDFSSTAHLVLNGNASAPVGPANVLRLTPADIGQGGSAWFDIEQPVSGGFTSVFTFQITNSNLEVPPGPFPADGLAFVIHAPVGDSDPGTHSLGVNGGGIGYDGIPNSLAIEFDTYQNGPPPDSNNDPDANHVGVQSCGSGPNSANHAATYVVNETPVSCNLGLFSPQTILANGQVHSVTVDYKLPDPTCTQSCTPHLSVALDGAQLFEGGIAVDLSTLLSLDNGKAWVGLTGATGALIENNDILSWSFTPHVSTSITQNVMPGVTTAFVFGEYNYKITPDTVTNVGTDTLTVTAIPVAPADFNPGPNFPGAQCSPYAGNNGNCAEFQVTCSGPDCNTGTYQVALNWDAPGTVNTNLTRGLLDAPDQGCPPPAAHPFSKNIFTGFQATRLDPVVKGSGGPRYSCFVSVQNVTYGNADLATINLASTKAKVGSNLTYAIGLTNFGPNSANGVLITDQLDPSTSFVNGTVAQTTCTFVVHGLTCTKLVPQACAASGQTVTCPVGVLGATTTQSVTAAAAAVVVSINPAACSSGTCPTLHNTAIVSAVNPDQKPANNMSTATTVVTTGTKK